MSRSIVNDRSIKMKETLKKNKRLENINTSKTYTFTLIVILSYGTRNREKTDETKPATALGRQANQKV